MWAANPREGGTEVPEVLDLRPLTRWNPPQRNFVPVPGERSPGQERSGAGSGSERTPSGFPRSSQAAKGTPLCVFNPFSSCWAQLRFLFINFYTFESLIFGLSLG